jgi:dihydroorotase
MAELVIRGGLVYVPGGPVAADVLVRDGVVAEVAGGASAPDAEVVDATGLWVLPGAIDAHVHSRDPGFPEKEDFGSLTAAAAAGGVTTVLDMPNTLPAVENAAVFAEKIELASSRAVVDFGLWGLLGARSSTEDLEGLVAAGVVGFKAFLGYPVRRSNRQVVYTLDLGDPDLEAPPDYGSLARLGPDVARLRVPLAVHAEDPGVLREFARPLASYADLLAARPAIAEAIAIAALGVISQRTGLHVHVVHLSSGLGLSSAREANRAGARLTLETAPQYLWLSDEDHGRLGAVMKMYPPIRTAADRAALQEAARTGEIQVVATDHAPHTDAEKLVPSLEAAAAGSPGVQTLYLSCLELGRRQGDVAGAVRWVTEGPALTLGLYPRKGALQAGADADLVLVDPGARTLLRPEAMLSRQRHGALDGQLFGFAVRAVYSRGELVARDGRVVAEAGRGRPVTVKRT